MKKFLVCLLFILMVSSTVVAARYYAPYYGDYDNGISRSREFLYERETEDSEGTFSSTGERHVSSDNFGSGFYWSGSFWTPGNYDAEWNEETSWTLHNERERVSIWARDDLYSGSSYSPYRDSYRNSYSPYYSGSSYSRSPYSSYSRSYYEPSWRGRGFYPSTSPRIAGLGSGGTYVYT